MRYALLALAAAVLAAATTGCTMCAHPYDNCGPVLSGDCGQCCDPNARAGSILSPPMDTVAEETSMDELTPADDVLMPLPEGDETAPPDITRNEPATSSKAPVQARSRTSRQYR